MNYKAYWFANLATLLANRVLKLTPMGHTSVGVSFLLVNWLNRLFCRIMYHVTPQSPPPLPPSGSVLLVSNHTSPCDAMVLSATAGRPLAFLMAREIYQRPHLRWLCQALNTIPITRGTADVGAMRAMLRVLRQGEVLGVFPEGGIDEYREESGYLGVGYLALTTGASVVPASIGWNDVRPLNLLGALLTPGRAVVRYGAPMVFQPEPAPSRERICTITASIMQAIRGLASSTGLGRSVTVLMVFTILAGS